MKNIIYSAILTLFLPASLHALTPHKVTYSVSLKRASPQSGIADAGGKMTFELKDTCDGWKIEQKSTTTLTTYGDDEGEVISANYEAWQSKDGKLLKFHSTRISNSGAYEEVEGTGEFKAGQPGIIRFTSPEYKTIKVPAGIIPPITHLETIISSAEKGTLNISKNVFDGSYYGDPVSINAFLGKSRQGCEILKKSNNKQNYNTKVWPVSLAIFGISDESPTPAFQVTQNLNSDGVMCSYTIDFNGRYALIGTPVKIEYPNNKVCKKRS